MSNVSYDDGWDDAIGDTAVRIAEALNSMLPDIRDQAKSAFAVVFTDFHFFMQHDGRIAVVEK